MLIVVGMIEIRGFLVVVEVVDVMVKVVRVILVGYEKIGSVCVIVIVWGDVLEV